MVGVGFNSGTASTKPFTEFVYTVRPSQVLSMCSLLEIGNTELAANVFPAAPLAVLLLE